MNETIVIVVSVVVALGGIALGWLIYSGRKLGVDPEKPRYYGYISCAILPLNVIFCYFVNQNSLFGGSWASFFTMLGVFWAIALVGFVIGIVNLVKGIKGSSLLYKGASFIGLIGNGIPALLGIPLWVAVLMY